MVEHGVFDSETLSLMQATLDQAWAAAIQQTGVAQVTYPAVPNDGQFQQLVQVLHRAYYACLLTAIEGRCDDFVRAKVQVPLSVRGKEYLAFNDYLEAALGHSGMAEDRKKYWRKYFTGMRILRNKCSQFGAALEPHEKTDLVDGGLGNHVSPSDDVQTEPADYVSLAGKALEFMREL